MEFQSKQTTPGELRGSTVSLFSSVPGRRNHRQRPPQDHASTDLRIQDPPADDHTPAARARKAKRRLRRLFERRGGMPKAERAFVEPTSTKFCGVRIGPFGRGGVMVSSEEIERELRAGAEVAVSRRSSLFLLLIRCSLPRLDIRAREQMGRCVGNADRQGIRSKQARWRGDRERFLKDAQNRFDARRPEVKARNSSQVISPLAPTALSTMPLA